MAMHNAGYGYQVGVGGKKDKSKAINYYTRRLRKLEAQGRSRISQNCLAAIDKLKPLLPTAQVDSAEKEVAAWLNAHSPKKQ